jgi:hypothetical protein
MGSLWNSLVLPAPGGGVLSTNDHTGTCRKHGSHFRRSGISVTPFSLSNLVYQWVVFSKFSQFFWKIGQFCLFGAKFPRKIQNFQKMSGFWYIDGSNGSTNWYIHRSTSDFPAAHPYQNQKLSTPPPRLPAQADWDKIFDFLLDTRHHVTRENAGNRITVMKICEKL